MIRSLETCISHFKLTECSLFGSICGTHMSPWLDQFHDRESWRCYKILVTAFFIRSTCDLVLARHLGDIIDGSLFFCPQAAASVGAKSREQICPALTILMSCHDSPPCLPTRNGVCHNFPYRSLAGKRPRINYSKYLARHRFNHNSRTRSSRLPGVLIPKNVSKASGGENTPSVLNTVINSESCSW